MRSDEYVYNYLLDNTLNFGSRAARDSASFPRSQSIQFRSFVHLMLSRVDDRRAAERRLFRKIFPCEDDAVPVTLV